MSPVDSRIGFWSGLPYAIGVCSAQGAGKNWIGGGDDMVDLVIDARDDHS